MDDHQLYQLAAKTGEALQPRGWRLTTAESCTGGWLAKVLTDIAGSSAWFDRGFVSYSNQAKCDQLGVSAELLETYGAVSREVVEAMASGALDHSRACIAVSISGIAGPGGGSDEKPTGTVWFAWAMRPPATAANTVVAEKHCFEGNRERVRRASVAKALNGILAALNRQGAGE